jgi:Fe-Mn family superoxide dismutase
MDHIRKTLDLLEAKEELKRVKLPVGQSSLAPVMNQSLVELHYGKLYKGYVDRYNSGEGDKSFNEAGAYLHGLFFGQFKVPDSMSKKPTGRMAEIIDREHKNFIDFKKHFKEEALQVRGSGWCYLSKSGQIKIIRDHIKRTDIALIIDMWEHSYQLQYGADKGKYIDNFWRIINWDTINRRL